MFQYHMLLKGAREMILTGNSLFSFRILSLESKNLQRPEILQPLYVMNHLLKVLGLVVPHSVFSPFYSQMPIMLNLEKFKT